MLVKVWESRIGQFAELRWRVTFLLAAVVLAFLTLVWGIIHVSNIREIIIILQEYPAWSYSASTLPVGYPQYLAVWHVFIRPSMILLVVGVPFFYLGLFTMYFVAGIFIPGRVRYELQDSIQPCVAMLTRLREWLLYF